MGSHNISPKKWYILDLRDPKNPIVPIKAFLFKELAVDAISRYFPNSSMVSPVIGQELIEFQIIPKYSAYRKFRFTIKAYPFSDGLTRREKHTLAKAFRRRRRIDKFREVNGLKPGETIKWGDFLPKNTRDKDGKLVKNRERYRLRQFALGHIHREYDHL